MSATRVAEALERDAHTIGDWLDVLREKGPTALAFEQSGGSPRPHTGTASDIESGGAGCAKRCRGGTGQVNVEKRKAFVCEYVALRRAAQAGKVKIFFVDEVHFRADVELRSQWVLGGEPALVDSSSPRMGEKATYYSAVCLETGEVEMMPVEGNTNAETSVVFLKQLREKYPGQLIMIWDNGPAHRGKAMRTYLKTPNFQLRLVALPAYSPDFNPDEAIWE